MKNMDYLCAENVTVGYGTRAVVENIALSLKRGQIATLIGANGCGKSTILKSFVGQLSLLEGNIMLDGRLLGRYKAAELAKKTAMVLTERIHTELMTCGEVAATGRYPYTGRMGFLSALDKEKVRQALAMVQAEELASVPFDSVSDGQRQRVMLARAICQEPELLILDEPTSFLDIRHKLELLSILENLVRQKNLAVFMSLHELDLAQKISDTVICIKDGQIDRIGAPEDVIQASYIAKLYGIDKGSYHAQLGFLELEGAKGKPEVFVIGGGGQAIPVYHRLQRQNVPFYAGVLHENDIEYPVAKALAVKVVSERAFEPISAERANEAWRLLGTCRRVICPVAWFGPCNMENQKMLERARKAGIAVE